MALRYPYQAQGQYPDRGNIEGEEERWTTGKPE
jgi:hypothetical protein